MTEMEEHEIEPVKGLPETLPESEPMRWQGAPDWRQLAIRVFHVRKIAVYFLLLVVAHIGFGIADGVALAKLLTGSAWLTLLGTATVAILSVLAWLYGKTTVYTITEQRLVMRFGVVLTMMINIPWSKLDSADLTLRDSGSGDITLKLVDGEKASYVVLWPHARPWHFAPVQPMLRCLPDAEKVAVQLKQVLGQRASADEGSASINASTTAHAVYPGNADGPTAVMS